MSNITLNSRAATSPVALRVLEQSANAKIHSTFANGFHLILGEQLVYVSAHPPTYLGAFDLRIERRAFSEILSSVKTGQIVKIRDETLTFYTRPHILTLELDVQSVPDLRLKPFIPLDFSPTASFILKELQVEQVFEGSGFFDHQTLKQVLAQIKEDKKLTDKAVLELIGAGAGLTPAGDDFLQGYLLMDLLTGKEGQVAELIEAGLNKRSTTDVTLNYYRALKDGWVNEFWLVFFDACRAYDKPQISQTIQLIKHYGHSSGRDLLLGVGTYLNNHY